MVHKILMVVILIVLPTFLHSQIKDVNGWSYAGAWGYTDTVNTVMRIEEGPTPNDSVQRFNSYGWTTQPSGTFWALQNSFRKFQLKQAQYQWPDTILIDFKILRTTNTYLLIVVIGLLDTTNQGFLRITYNSLANIPGWQTEKRIFGSGVHGNYVSMIGMDFALYSYDSAYVGLEIQANNLRFVYKNGDTILIDPFQIVWPKPVGISDEKQTPSEFVLSQNYPNPFNPSTQITYSLPTSGEVKLSVYNLLGQEAATLVDGDQSIGQHTVTFDASHLASGTYLYVLSVDNKIIDRKKMMLLK